MNEDEKKALAAKKKLEDAKKAEGAKKEGAAETKPEGEANRAHTQEDNKPEAAAKPAHAPAKKAPIPTKDQAVPGFKADYTRGQKLMIEEIKLLGGYLNGGETPEELEIKLEALSVEENHEISEQEVIPGVPNQLRPRFEKRKLGKADVNFAVHFVAACEDGRFALYNETGKRISPPYSAKQPVDNSGAVGVVDGTRAIAKMAADNNARRFKTLIPGDLPAIPAPQN